jgi:hypothetical protein
MLRVILHFPLTDRARRTVESSLTTQVGRNNAERGDAQMCRDQVMPKVWFGDRPVGRLATALGRHLSERPSEDGPGLPPTRPKAGRRLSSSLAPSDLRPM